jgi:prepilin-type N-terminal cleavage/methylation domain-containing protein
MRNFIHTKKDGFSLVELLISISVLSVVSLISYIALRTTTEAASQAEARAQIQTDLRYTMQMLTREISEAYSQRSLDERTAPEGTNALEIGGDGMSISFQRPELSLNTNIVRNSTPILIQYVNEDLNSDNAELDGGEDSNLDKALTRRVVAIQDGEMRFIGNATTISGMQFELLSSPSLNNDDPVLLRVRLQASTRFGADKRLMVQELDSVIRLEN